MREVLKSVSAIWGDEDKSIEECAERIYDFLHLLKNHNHGLFSEWYEQAKSLKKALELRIDLTPEYFYDKVKKNWDKQFPDLGTSVWLWTGHKKEGYSAVISFRVGGHPNNSNLKNSCVLTLPYEGEFEVYYKDLSNRQELMRLMYDFWKPDYLKVNGERIDNF